MKEQLQAFAASLLNDNGDPPDTDYQRGYMAACDEIAARLTSILEGGDVPERAKVLQVVEWAAQYGREMGKSRATCVAFQDRPSIALEDYVREIADRNLFPSHPQVQPAS